MATAATTEPSGACGSRAGLVTPRVCAARAAVGRAESRMVGAGSARESSVDTAGPIVECVACDLSCRLIG